MLEEEREPTICLECESEFIVETLHDDNDLAIFCPFCGSELDLEELDEEDDLEDN